MSGQVQWTIVAAPNAGLGPRRCSASPTSSGSGRPSRSRCGSTPEPEDVVEEWRRHRDRLGARAAALTALELDAVRYHGEGTDLTAGLIAGLRAGPAAG